MSTLGHRPGKLLLALSTAHHGDNIAPVSLDDLVSAYRKAKVDLFYSSDPRRLDLVEYEENLAENLASLQERIDSDNEAWTEDPSYLGGFTFEPKRLHEPGCDPKSFWSDPSRAWRNRATQSGERPVAEFRLMSHCSLDLHVFSTLWMLEVGTLLDSRLLGSAFGNRLRQGPDGRPNRLGSGSFLPYQPAYQRWRDGGLRAMSRALSEQKEVIALTADVTAFYHHLDPAFLEHEIFLNQVVEVELDDRQAKLNRLFVSSLHAWSQMVATQMGWRDRGLPVGLPASAVVANLALAELDRVVTERFAPLYYGRYVDDVLLVLEADGELTDQHRLWDWMVARSGGLLTSEPLAAGDSTGISDAAIRFVPGYLDSSTVAFENSKNKTFHLSGRSGATMIDSIRATIRERSSEWRSLVTVPDDVNSIGPAVASVLRADGDDATTLRDADRVSARKQSFSLRLRDFGAYERNLPPEEWIAQRREFISATCDHILALPAFFELASYLPRVVTLVSACRDRDALVMLFDALARLIEDVRATCSVRVAAFSPIDAAGERHEDPAGAAVLDRWIGHLVDQAVDEMTSGWFSRMKAADLRELMDPLRSIEAEAARRLPGVTALSERHRRMAQRDLAHRPYRWSLLRLPNADVVAPATAAPVPIDPVVRESANLLVAALQHERGRPRSDLRLDGGDNAGIVFATRPPTLMELHAALPSDRPGQYGVTSSSLVGRILNGLRGHFGPQITTVRVRQQWPTVISVRVRQRRGPVRVALAMLGVDETDARDAAKGSPNLTRERFDHLRDLLGSVARHGGHPDYVVLPELALPARWFPELARALRRSGISVISGIEHQPSGTNRVANQVWAALRVDGWGLRYFLYRQDKQRPARPEKKILDELHLKLAPQQRWRLPPVVEHGDFRFAMLICSELTNIDYRAHLRGAVDALIVPEWNMDVHWFEALVESASLDLHAFIAQANTLGFGDTRLRAPMAKPFARDVVRLKGGTHDYFVMGDLDVDWLRRFQTAAVSAHPAPAPPARDTELKPLPDGFRIDPDRRLQ